VPKTNSVGFTVMRLLNLIDPKHELKKDGQKAVANTAKRKSSFTSMIFN